MSLFDRFRRNKTPKKKPSANEHAPRHCFVLCKTAELGGSVIRET
jgi:hypothetical protein